MASTRVMRAAVKRSKGAVDESHLYAVVYFDDAIGVVPWNHVTMVDSTNDGKKCRVLWSDGLSYDAVVIFKGTKAHCLLREKEELKKEEENESSEMEKENEPPSQMEREDKLLPSVPLKKRKRVVKQKLQKPDNTKPAKDEATVAKQTKNRKLSKKKDCKSKKPGDTKTDLPEFIIHVSSSPPWSPTSKLPLQNATNATSNEMVKDNDDEVEDPRGLNDASVGSIDDISRTSDDEGGDMILKTLSVPLTDGTSPKRIESPVHIFSSVQGNQLDKMRREIHLLNDEQEYRFDKVFARLDGIEKQIKVLFTSGVASALASSPTVQCSSNLAQQHQFAVQAPLNQSVVNQPVVNQPVVNQPVVNQPVLNQPWDASQLDTSVTSVELDTSAVLTSTPSSVSHPATLQSCESDDVGDNVDNTEELLPSSKLVPILMKHKTRRSLAAALVTELVDLETRLRSNVRGKSKKDQLDPRIICYVKRKCFELHPSKEDPKKEWDDCIISIDNQARDMKRRLNSQK